MDFTVSFYTENPLPIKLPLPVGWLAGTAVMIGNALWTTRACTAILKDVVDLDPPQLYPESERLVQLMWYMARGPLLDFYNQINAIHARLEEFGGALEALDGALMAAEFEKIQARNPGNDKGAIYQQAENYWRSINMASFPTVPNQSPIELLVRILSRHYNPILEHATYQEYLPTLKVSQLLSAATEVNQARAGVPKIIFICISHGVANSGNRVHIVTTSPDRWEGAPFIYNWARNNRANRMTQAEINGPTGFQQRTIGFYNNVNGALHNLYHPTQGDICGVKLKAINDFTKEDPRRWFDHLAEIGAPYDFPTCVPRARCYKCRAVFGYKLSKGVQTAEADLINSMLDNEYPPDSCAEVLAHCLCVRAGCPGVHPT